VQGGKGVKLGLFWAWKAKLEQLKGEVERALRSVCDGLDLLGPGSKGVLNLKPKPKSKPKKGVKFKTFKLVPKPKPKQRLGFVPDHGYVRKPKIQSSKVGSFSGLVEGCGAPSFPKLVSASRRWF
jgi:hypothetical protein